MTKRNTLTDEQPDIKLSPNVDTSLELTLIEEILEELSSPQSYDAKLDAVFMWSDERLWVKDWDSISEMLSSFPVEDVEAQLAIGALMATRVCRGHYQGSWDCLMQRVESHALATETNEDTLQDILGSLRVLR
tara:strand:+ start:306 stop:704 length:399 start_codon:yes stop_codon:yes gene_type:complete